MAASIYLCKPPYVIGPVPSLSGHQLRTDGRSPPRVRRHRTSKPPGSSKRVLLWQVTMDQLICASLSHTHYWYEVGMLKVPAECQMVTSLYFQRHTPTSNRKQQIQFLPTPLGFGFQMLRSRGPKRYVRFDLLLFLVEYHPIK